MDPYGSTMPSRESGLICFGENGNESSSSVATAMSDPAYKAVLDSSPSSNSSWGLIRKPCSVKLTLRMILILSFRECGSVLHFCQSKGSDMPCSLFFCPAADYYQRWPSCLYGEHNLDQSRYCDPDKKLLQKAARRTSLGHGSWKSGCWTRRWCMGDRPRCFSSYVLAISPWLPFTLFINPSLTNSHYQSSKSKLTKPTPSSRSLHPLTVAISPSIFHTHFVLTYQVPSPSSLSPCHVHEPCMHGYSSNPMHGHFYSSPSYLHCFMPISTLITRLLYPHVHHLSLSLSTPHAFQTHQSHPSFPYPFPVNLFAPILTCIHHSRHHSPCLIPHAHTHFSSLAFPLTTPRTHPRPLGLITIYAHISIQLPRCSPILWTHHLPLLHGHAWPCMAASCSFHDHAHFVPVSPHPYPYPCKRSSMQMSRAT